MSDQIQTLKKHAEQLVSLLSDPQPGLFTWQKACLDELRALNTGSQGEGLIDAHIAELRRQLAESREETKTECEVVAALRVQIQEANTKARKDEAAQWEPLYTAARDVLGAVMPGESDDPTGRIVFILPNTQLAALRDAMEAKRPTPGVYPSRGTKYILRKGDSGFVYFYRQPENEGVACWTQDKDAAKRFDTATAASIFAIQRGLGGVEVDAV